MTKTIYPSTLRRHPLQARARARVARLLDCARAIIAEIGADELTMTELAHRADVPIGSVYQYFEDRTAVLAVLMEEATAMAARTLQASVSQARNVPELADGATAAALRLYVAFRSIPYLRDLWSGTEAHKKLRPIDIEASRSTARWFAAKVSSLSPAAMPAAQIECSAFLMCEFCLSAVRLASEMPEDEGARLMESFAATLHREILIWAG